MRTDTKGISAFASPRVIRGPLIRVHSCPFVVQNRKEKHMKLEITLILIVAIGIVAAIVAKMLRKLRHEFTVPDGYAGLLYHHGKFVAPPLQPGRHVRWGRNFQVAPYDLRKVTHTVAGQEVLTADNVSLKVSLLVTCQFADVVKAIRET